MLKQYRFNIQQQIMVKCRKWIHDGYLELIVYIYKIAPHPPLPPTLYTCSSIEQIF